MTSKVNGSFGAFTGSFVTGENPLDTKVTAPPSLLRTGWST
jgi:hypothetical protein